MGLSFFGDFPATTFSRFRDAGGGSDVLHGALGMSFGFPLFFFQGKLDQEKLLIIY